MGSVEYTPAMRQATTLLRWGLAALYLISGGLKLADPAAFAESLDHYRLVPPALAYALSLYVPWLEVFAAAALLVKRWQLAGWLLAILLGIGFSIFVTSAWIRGIDVSCGCFGASSQQPVGSLVVIRAMALTAAGAWGAWRTLSTLR